MATTLEQFARQCHDALKSEPGTAGRRRVCALVADVLKDPGFIATHIPDGTPERKVLYEDPELGFAILAHGYQGAKNSKPHDHGTSWAIYGQAEGETIMTDWALVERPADGKPGRARQVCDYTMTPGMAYLYEPGALHSPRREDSTKLLRIEGVNLANVKRLPYEAVEAARLSPAAE
jgi:hypothetical protein